MKKIFLFLAATMMAAISMADVLSNLQALKLVNNQLCQADNTPIQLRGWSTNDYKNFRVSCDEKADFVRMKNSGATVIRIAVDPHEYASDLTNMLLWVKNSIDYCAELDLYCIIDWHILVPGDPNHSDYSGAPTFFSEISAYVKDKNYRHVLYEICGEPNLNEEGTIYENGQTVWSQIKTYATTVLSVIKVNDPNAIVIVGTPQWCQGLVFPMVDPMDEQGMNVMYSFHSNTGDEENYLGLLSSASAFLPIFVSEWRLLPHSGNCSFEESKPVADLLMNICNGQNLGGQKISWCNWGWYQKEDVGSAFTDYAASIWSQSGNYVKNILAAGDNFITRATTDYDVQEISDVNDTYLALEKFDNGGKGNAYWDYDAPFLCGGSTPCSGNFGKAGAEDGIRDDQSVDLGYTNESVPDDGYISLFYILDGEWVQYTVNVAVAGEYDFELYSNNYISDNIMAIAVDGENALVDADGNEPYKAIQIPPCHGGTTDGSGYSEWGWIDPKSPIDASKQFRIRFKTTGEHKLALAFMTECAGLGTIKLKGNPTTAIDEVIVPNGKETATDANAVKRLVNGQLLIETNGRTYNAQGAELR